MSIFDKLKSLFERRDKISGTEIMEIVCEIAAVLNAACGGDHCAKCFTPKPRVMHKMGLKFQKPDVRDLKRFIDRSAPVAQSVDLRPGMPPVYDQGQLGSCTANAISGAVQYLCMKEKYKFQFTPSRLFLYYNERVIEGTVLEDSGAELRDGLKALNSEGICPEAEGDGTNPDWLWPYSDGLIKFRLQPPAQCYKDAVLHKAIKYESVPLDANAMRQCLSEGFPVIIGINVYSSFESQQAASTGEIPMPDTSTEQLLGGHALLVVGYRADGSWIVRNSWGASWGDHGYCYLPEAYLTNPNLASDFWCLELEGDVA